MMMRTLRHLARTRRSHTAGDQSTGLRLSMVLAALLLVWQAAAGAAVANTGQYYLVARPGPAGSVTTGVTSAQVVYLRWDTLEGQLPVDVARLRLVRDGDTVLLDEPVDAVMDAGAIAGLYAGAAQERRLVEMLRLLKEQAVSEGRDFDLGDFGEAIRERIDPASEYENAAWSFLASRADVNVARARYRAFVDDPGPGQFEYELLAVDAVGGTARLGLAQVNTLVSQDILSPNVFRQVLQARCDLPELGLDHYTVALDWDSPGSGNPADRVAAQVYVAGYDIYRTTENLDPLALAAPARDLRAEAATATFDNRGEPVLAGLEKVNDTLLTIVGDAQTDPDWEEEQGGVPIAGGLVPEWLETQDQLADAGLKPGDKRGYYLVPRDFTGNYGATLAAVVVVPNRHRPPAPWELRNFVDQVGTLTSPPEPRLAISWDKVDVDNYLDAYQGTRVFCNLSEARVTGVLEFVAEGESCDEDVRRSVRLDVSTYRVYRFEGFDEAARFKDSDGDGVADSIERPEGMQCDPSAQPARSEDDDRRLDPLSIGLRDVTLPKSGRTIVRMSDDSPKGPLGEVFWYRVASETPDGRFSVLSAPQRALYPDREPPPRPIVQTFRRDREEDGGCELEVIRTGGSWSFREELDGQPFLVTCGARKFYTDLTEQDLFHGGTSTCETIVEECGTELGGSIGLQYPQTQEKGDPYQCAIVVPDDLPEEDQGIAFCSQGAVRLVPSYEERFVQVQSGDVSTGIAVINVQEPVPDTCVTLYENIDGASTKVATTCGDEADPFDVRYEAESGYFCGFAVTQDENNNISATVHTPCTVILAEEPKAPATPQPVDFSVSDRVADFAWRLPIEPVAVTLARLEHRPGDGTRTRTIHTVPSPGSGGGDVLRHAVDVPSLVGDRDEWCVSFLAIGPNPPGVEAKRSDWSSPRCVYRRSDGEEVPEYLPWPAVEAAAVDPRPLSVGVQGFGLGGLYLYFDLLRLTGVDAETLQRNCYFDPVKSQFFMDAKCSEEGKLLTDGLLAPQLGFVVYRQSKGESGPESDWVQVSPLIEFAHWDAYDPGPTEPKFIGRYLRDPYIHMRRNLPDTPRPQALSFVDQYPYGVERSYRYQIVYFSDDHRVVRTRTSDWLYYDPIGSIQGGGGGP